MNHAQHTLSAIVITRNEAHNLHDCLQSMQGLVDEIIVVDSQSTDATVAIAQQHGAKVAQPADWPGFGPQKNRALNLATCDWVFDFRSQCGRDAFVCVNRQHPITGGQI
jgi:glycosyltransferase involved in cell wall biosynthesis